MEYHSAVGIPRKVTYRVLIMEWSPRYVVKWGKGYACVTYTYVCF